jgi:sugar phosphate isomerase/epimerase
MIALKERFGCSSLTFRNLPLSEALERISKNGFRFIDISIIPPDFCPHFDPVSASQLDIDGLNLSLKEFNLAPVSIDIVPGYFNSGKASEVRTFIMKSVDLAAGISAKIVTIPSGKAVQSAEL